MNIYRLKSEEVRKLHNEFNKTDFGRRAKAFAMLPLAFAMILLIMFITDIFFKDENELFLCFTFLNFSLFCISQLQYGNMLKDFAKSKNDKE